MSDSEIAMVEKSEKYTEWASVRLEFDGWGSKVGVRCLGLDAGISLERKERIHPATVFRYDSGQGSCEVCRTAMLSAMRYDISTVFTAGGVADTVGCVSDTAGCVSDTERVPNGT